MKMVISRYINSGSCVLGCYLDASKAFDRVDHGLLFQKLEERGLPPAILNFLLSWYRTQQMKVQWDPKSTSDSFTVTNSVRQGGVLSPFLFAVYLDNLLCELSLSGVGCHWRWMFAGVFCFADDIVLLAPCASALRRMLAICTSFASSHGLLFNTGKTQLILFRKNASKLPNDVINFNGTTLQYSEYVQHLGHLLSFNLDDKEDISRATKKFIRTVLCTFRFAGPFVLTYLLKSYCLSLYGCTLCFLSSLSIKSLQIAINKILRKIWNLPRYSHTSIVLCTARINYIYYMIFYRFSKFMSRCLDMDHPLVSFIISDSMHLTYSFIGYNFRFGSSLNDNDLCIANTYHMYGSFSPI